VRSPLPSACANSSPTPGATIWNAAVLEALLARVGYASKTLDDWLRNGFFECSACRIISGSPPRKVLALLEGESEGGKRGRSCWREGAAAREAGDVERLPRSLTVLNIGELVGFGDRCSSH